MSKSMPFHFAWAWRWDRSWKNIQFYQATLLLSKVLLLLIILPFHSMNFLLPQASNNTPSSVLVTVINIPFHDQFSPDSPVVVGPRPWTRNSSCTCSSTCRRAVVDTCLQVWPESEEQGMRGATADEVIHVSISYHHRRAIEEQFSRMLVSQWAHKRRRILHQAHTTSEFVSAIHVTSKRIV